MCVGALLESDVEALVYAARQRPLTAPPARSSSSPSTRPCRGRIKIVSGIRRDEAERLFAPLADALTAAEAPVGSTGVRLVSSPAERCPSG